MALAASEHARARATASAICDSTFSSPAASISGPCDTGFIAGAHGQLGNAARQLLGEDLIDRVLHQDAVGADAGLPSVAIFGDEHALDRGIKVGVVEDDEARVAAEFQRQFLDRRRTLRHQQPADLGRPVKEGDGRWDWR